MRIGIRSPYCRFPPTFPLPNRGEPIEMRRRRAHEEEEGEGGGAVRRTKRRRTNLAEMMKPDDRRRKRRRRSPSATATPAEGTDYCDALPDDLVLSVLAKLSSSASSPSDLISVTLTCKRLNQLGLQPQVLARASAKALAIRAKNWSDAAHRFLKRCSDADNLEASYILGMIRFYCLESRGSGAALMARAAMGSHAGALYALAIIQFNGSGGAKGDKDLRAGVALCARAAALGHVDALRELGHCLQDGYGVRRNVAEGRRFLVQANARELAAVLTTTTTRRLPVGGVVAAAGCCPLLSDFGWSVPPAEPHPANRFLVEWFAGRGAGVGVLRMCSHAGCGRAETRRHEFRRCSVCGAVNYCSRACQALDWKLSHKADCTPMDRWLLDPPPEAEPAAPAPAPAPAAPAADVAMG